MIVGEWRNPRRAARSHIPHRYCAGAVVAAFMLSQGCATIGPATPKLAVEVSERVLEMERLHVVAVKNHFQGERRRVNEFLKETWEPLFLENFLAESGVLHDLADPAALAQPDRSKVSAALNGLLSDPAEEAAATNTVLRALGSARADQERAVRVALDRYVEDANLTRAVERVLALLGSGERGRILLEFVEDAHREMNAQRDDMLQPLIEVEVQVLAGLRESYAELEAGLARITSRLEAAAKLKETQDTLLSRLSVGDTFAGAKVRLLRVSDVVDESLAKARDLAGRKGSDTTGKIGDSIREELRKLLEVEDKAVKSPPQAPGARG